MLEFKSLETSFLVIVNEQKYSLTESDVDLAFYHTADLIDNNHQGHAMVDLGSKTVVLSPEEWRDLYDFTEEHIQNAIEYDELAGVVIH